MKLFIGGYAQGKLGYVLKKYHLTEARVWDAELPEDQEAQRRKLQNREPVIMNHFHLWVKESMKRGECPEELLRQWLESYPDGIIISDEIGNGIVPIDAFEREYRERTGRMLVELAERAEEVERILCGIGQKIK